MEDQDDFTAMFGETVMKSDTSGGPQMPPAPSVRKVECLNRTSSELIVKALLEDIASDMHHGSGRGVTGRASPLNREELYWNVCLDELDAVENPASGVVPAILGLDQIPPARHQSVAVEPETRGTIVLAEDDEATRTLLCRVLSRAGFTVHACENGRLACTAVLRNLPDAVLLDWMMPVMDGPAAVAFLKSDLDTRGIPVVMLSTQSEIEERVAAFKTGVQDFVTKPFDPRDLVARIEQQIRWRKMLTVDANTACVGERLELHRPLETESAARIDRTLVHSFFDCILRELPKRMS